MALPSLFVLLFLLGFVESQPITHPFNHTDMKAAIRDMTAKSYYGFAMLLQMLNGSSQPSARELTFLMPDDKELSASSISIYEVEEFVLKHAIPMPLYFNDLSHFPTGTLVPSGISLLIMRKLFQLIVEVCQHPSLQLQPIPSSISAERRRTLKKISGGIKKELRLISSSIQKKIGREESVSYFFRSFSPNASLLSTPEENSQEDLVRNQEGVSPHQFFNPGDDLLEGEHQDRGNGML
ncbi:hypothetical protein Fmac_009320 [Flemingia macrophylla]|uniref:Uncharacterized protein n=1 Tax=Flemingia macrophylla TaxID=520843 RepID=A0ABD1MZW8_9FABA